MHNSDIQATWHYHNGTKHPDGALLNRRHSFDPARQPILFKIYENLEPIALPLDLSPCGMSTLQAIARNDTTPIERGVLDIGVLARILYFSAGITKKIAYPWGEHLFRAASCTGALYHIELYVVCGDLPGLPAGVYHFGSHDMALRRLRAGDYRRVLLDATGSAPAIAQAPAIIACTDITWRNACKYQAREYRHRFWDSGTILAHTLAMCAAHRLPAELVTGFVDATVNGLLDLDTQREVALVLAPIGYTPEPIPMLAPEVAPLALPTRPISDREIDFPAIRAMHEASSLADAAEVASWHGELPSRPIPEPVGQVRPLEAVPENELPQDGIEKVILRRGSTRRFSRESITFRQLSIILQQAANSIGTVFTPPPSASLNELYLIVNAVDDLAAGAYVFHRERQALELLQEGDFRDVAGQLGLYQDLPADASINVYCMADLGPILERFGNRGYRAAQLEASVIAGRMYLAAYAQRLGATGLTFFDDDVTSFFSPHARHKSPMFLIALGKRTRA